MPEVIEELNDAAVWVITAPPNLNLEEEIVEIRSEAASIIDGALQGSPGIAGTNWRGTWSSSSTYQLNDGVFYGGSSWRALRTNLNVTPIEGADWTFIAEKGNTGDTGLPGLNWRDAWQSGITYLQNDAVTDNGSSWRALRTNIDVQPAVGLDWDYVAQKGALGGDAYYVHNQIVAASTWLVSHNLNKFPSIFARDTGGNTIDDFELNHIDQNNAELSFYANSQLAAFSGTAYCN
jgi:hypothetical protein